MKRHFLIRLVLFLLPVAAYSTVVFVAPYYNGEYLPLDRVIQLQLGAEPVLYGPGFTENEYMYKFLAAQARQPEVLVLGSSRSMQMRAGFFNRNPEAFYNAGGAGRGFKQMQRFLTSLSETHLPDVVLLEISQSWAAGSRAPLTYDEGSISPDFAQILNTSRLIFAEILRGNLRAEHLFSRRDPLTGYFALGYNAVTYGDGFRNDGSRQHGRLITAALPISTRLYPHFVQQKNGTAHFARGAEPDPAALEDLRLLLEECKKLNLRVIGYSPTYAPSLYEAMLADGQHDYLQHLEPTLSALFKEYGFAYFDFSNAAWLGATDDDMFDGIHPTEYVTLLEYIRLLKALPDVLGSYSDLEYLERISQNAENPFEVFGRL